MIENQQNLSPKESFNLLHPTIERFFEVFQDEELRKFVCGDVIDIASDARDYTLQLFSHADEILSLFFGITNAIYAYLVSAFSDKMAKELATSDDVSGDARSYCVERVENTLFGLYDTYDATDDVVKFVVFNAALAIGVDTNLQKSLGFSRRSSFTEYRDADAPTDEENLLDIFRWMFNHRISFTDLDGVQNLIIKRILDDLPLVVKKLKHLIEYASFFKDISLRKSEADKGAYDFVRQDGTVLRSHYIVYKRGNMFYLLRSIDTTKKNEHSILLKYSYSNESETAIKTVIQIFDRKSQERASLENSLQIEVSKNVGEVYSEITNGLIRKRIRSSFCGGLSGYKYYAELAASIIDALEIFATRDRNMSVVKYLAPIVTADKNFSICKDECVCTRPSCKKLDMSLCQGNKRFDHPDFGPDCLGNMRLLPILTLLLIVAGTKSILPQVFAQVKTDPDDLFEMLNRQLSLRFTQYNQTEVIAFGKRMYDYNIEKSSLTLNIDDIAPDNLPDAVKTVLYKLKARAYTVAIVNELERIEQRLEHNSNVQKVRNVDNYSIKDMYDIVEMFEHQATSYDNEEDALYAKRCLRQVLMTVLCYYGGLSKCIAQQFEYEIKLENSIREGSVNIDEYKEKIESAFFSGVVEELRCIEGENYKKKPRKPSFFELFKELRDRNADSRDKKMINLALGRDMLDTPELFDIVHLNDEKGMCFVGKSNDNWLDLDDEAECSARMKDLFKCVKEILGYFYNRNVARGVGVYPQVLTFSSQMINRDDNIIRKFIFYSTENDKYNNRIEKEYNIFTFFAYEINKRYFFVPPKKHENSNWLTHPILIGCAEFCEEVFGKMTRGDEQ